jgi:hypothetical protein
VLPDIPQRIESKIPNGLAVAAAAGAVRLEAARSDLLCATCASTSTQTGGSCDIWVCISSSWLEISIGGGSSGSGGGVTDGGAAATAVSVEPVPIDPAIGALSGPLPGESSGLFGLFVWVLLVALVFVPRPSAFGNGPHARLREYVEMTGWWLSSFRAVMEQRHGAW